MTIPIESLDEAVRIVNSGMRVLNQRLLTLVALVFAAILSGWAMYDPKWERLVAIALFSVSAWCLTRLGKPAD